jgi:hypothetical protein
MGHGAQVTRGGVVVSIALAHVLAPFPRIVSERTEQRARALAAAMARIDAVKSLSSQRTPEDADIDVQLAQVTCCELCGAKLGQSQAMIDVRRDIPRPWVCVSCNTREITVPAGRNYWATITDEERATHGERIREGKARSHAVMMARIDEAQEAS